MLDDSAFAGSMRTASRFMGDIERLGSETLADVHESERIYVETVRKTTERARRLADLWTARTSGWPSRPTSGRRWPSTCCTAAASSCPAGTEIIDRGQQIAAERRFLHWELEFPEVFFDQHGRLQGDAAGFDAVIGNPPWGGKNIALDAEDFKFLSLLGVDNLNYFPYFLAVGLNITAARRCLSMIVPDSLLTKNYPLTRKELLTRRSVLEIDHLMQPFDDVDHDAVIILVGTDFEKDKPILCKVVPKGEFNIHAVKPDVVNPDAWRNERLEYRFVLGLDYRLEQLSQKLYGQSVSYADICETHEGIHTRHRRSDIFPECAQSLLRCHKPVLIGERSGDRFVHISLSGEDGM